MLPDLVIGKVCFEDQHRQVDQVSKAQDKVIRSVLYTGAGARGTGKRGDGGGSAHPHPASLRRIIISYTLGGINKAAIHCHRVISQASCVCAPTMSGLSPLHPGCCYVRVQGMRVFVQFYYRACIR